MAIFTNVSAITLPGSGVVLESHQLGPEKKSDKFSNHWDTEAVMLANRTKSKSHRATADEITQIRDALRERFASLVATLSGVPA